jgi:pyruvate dehydrogenase E2 component (dihydrolipoamide acetyltransferase)
MATLLTMPALVPDAAEVVLNTWLKAVGDPITQGEAIAEFETEKATVELEADRNGVLARTIANPGDTVAVGAPIGIIAESDETETDIETLLANVGAGKAAPTNDTKPAAVEAATNADNGRVFSSPIARRLAREHGVDANALMGSGPGGRIIRKDVEAAVSEAPTTAPTSLALKQTTVGAPGTSTADQDAETVPFTRMRQAIARRLTESKTTVPHFYITVDVNMDKLLTMREQINLSAPRKITVNDLVVRAIGLALREVPDSNVTFNGDGMLRHNSVDVSVAIAIDGGLLTPVVRAVDSSSITEISTTIADYAARAQAGKIRPAELEGGSFTVSNLGMFGTKEFAAILNPPQAGILAVGAAEQRAVVVDGNLSVATVMTCTLSVDHRFIDGAVAARLMAAFKLRMESPMSLLI